MPAKIIIIEDDKVIIRFLSLALKTYGYDVITSELGLTGLNLIINHKPDLVLLDLGLPDKDGVEIINEIRVISEVPIIVISAREKEIDKITALDAGADDFVTKPFNIGEVLARIRVALRHKMMDPSVKNFDYKGLFVDFEKYKVYIFEKEVHLTPMEYKLLELLVKNQGKVLTHNFIQNKVWGYSTVDDFQTLRVFMASIRRKLEDNDKEYKYIKTEIGVGYRFRED